MSSGLATLSYTYLSLRMMTAPLATHTQRPETLSESPELVVAQALLALQVSLVRSAELVELVQ